MSHLAYYVIGYLTISFGLAILIGKSIAFGMGTDQEEESEALDAIPVAA